MLYLAIGLPGRFSARCAAAIAALLGSDVEVAAVPALDEMLGAHVVPTPFDGIARALIGIRAEHLVVLVRHPNERLRAALATGGTRFVMALDHPADAAADILDEAGAVPQMAVRAIANGSAAMTRCAALPGALPLDAQSAESDPIATAEALAGHLGIIVTPSVIARAAARLSTRRNRDAGHRFPAESRKMMLAALSGYANLAGGGGVGQLIWNRDLFAAADPGRIATDLLDLAGGARIIVYGPYIELPPGSWTARVELWLSPEAAGHTLLIDVYAGVELAAATLQPASGGIFAVEVNFALDDEISQRPIEVRVTVTQNDAKGQLAFGRVVLRVEALRRPDAVAGPEEFATLLDL